jgi:hypothetical protein
MPIKTRIFWRIFLEIIKKDEYANESLDLSDEPLNNESVTEFVGAMNSNARIKHLKISYGFMGCCIADILIRISLTALDMSRHGLSKKGFQTLCDFLPHNKSLAVLNISRNHINGDGMKMLAKALGGGHVSDERNRIEHFACNRTLKKIDLSYNPIGDEGACALAKVIHSNANPHLNLASLDITGCSIWNYGAKALLGAIAKNSSLRRLAMDERCLSSDASKSLLKCNATITDLQLFDHSAQCVKALDEDLLAWLEKNKARVAYEHVFDKPIRWGKVPCIGDPDLSGMSQEAQLSAADAVSVATAVEGCTAKGGALKIDSHLLNIRESDGYFLKGADFSGASLVGMTLDIRAAYVLVTQAQGLSGVFKKALEKEAVERFKAAYKAGLKCAYPNPHYFSPDVFYCGKRSKDLTLKDIIEYVDSRPAGVNSRSRDICCGPKKLKLRFSQGMAALNFSLERKLMMAENQGQMSSL